MKIIFAGTPAFAVVALDALYHANHEILAVYTQPDRPAGRGLKLTPSPVKEFALSHNLLLKQPASLKGENEQAELADLQADVMVVAAYGLLLPKAVLTIPRLGCINIHPSLLPRWRGAAPIQRSIYAGDQLTGVTIMQMDAGLDTGPILLQREYQMSEEETSQTLHDQLAKLGAKTLLETLDLLAQGKVTAKPQTNDLATYAEKISKEEALIDWQLTAIELEHRVRAFNPWPVAYATWQGESLRIWRAKAIDEISSAAPGTLLAASSTGIDIACGKGVLRLLTVQRPGGKIISIADFYRATHAHHIIGSLFL